MTLLVAIVAFIAGGITGIVTMAVLSADKEKWDGE